MRFEECFVQRVAHNKEECAKWLFICRACRWFSFAPHMGYIELGVSSAHSEARQCRALRSELASLSTGKGNKNNIEI